MNVPALRQRQEVSSAARRAAGIRRTLVVVLVLNLLTGAAKLTYALSVIAGLVAVHFGFARADLVIALAVPGAIAWAAWTIIRDTFLVLSDAAAVSNEEIDQVARSVPGVEGVHNIRTRGGEGAVWADMHIQVDPDLSVAAAHDIASDVAARVEQEIGRRADVTVHVEPAYPEHLQPERGHRPERGER